MFTFRSEIRNSPNRGTIKVFLSDKSFSSQVKDYLEEYFSEIDFIEIRETIDRNRESENLTVFLKSNANINIAKEAIDSYLQGFFEQENKGQMV